MPFSKDVADSVLVKCGRHCCICRRFKPTMLQVHHILEESRGGSSDEENAIPLCVTCHIDVHTKTPFAQRFSPDELREHRDRVYRLVEEGKLVAEERDVEFRPIVTRTTSVPDFVSLSSLAQEILVAAASEESYVLLSVCDGGGLIQAGSMSRELGHGRQLAEAKSAINELETLRCLEVAGPSREVWDVTLRGYQVADALAAMSVGDVR